MKVTSHKTAAYTVTSKTIQIRGKRHASHSWKSKGELISDVPQWTPSLGQVGVEHSTSTYLQQLCTDTGCRLADRLKAINDIDEWRGRVREIHLRGTTWYIYKYIPTLPKREVTQVQLLSSIHQVWIQRIPSRSVAISRLISSVFPSIHLYLQGEYLNAYISKYIWIIGKANTLCPEFVFGSLNLFSLTGTLTPQILTHTHTHTHTLIHAHIYMYIYIKRERLTNDFKCVLRFF